VIRIILLALFVVMLTGEALGLNVSVAPGVSTKNALLYLLFSWIAIETIVARNRKFICRSVVIPFSVLLGYAMFSWLVVVLIVDYANYDALKNAIGLKSQMADSLLMLLVFMFGLTKTEDAIWMFRMIAWMVILSNIVILADAFGVPDLEILDWSREGRLEGFVGQPNQYGAFLAIFLPATLALVIAESGARRVLAAIGAVVSLVCLILTFSRGSYVGVVGGSILAVIFLRKYLSMSVIARVAVALVVVTAIAVPVLYVAGFKDIFLDRFSLTGGDAHTLTTGRSTLWTRAISVMLEQPISFLVGYGWNAYDSFREFRLSVHNAYLNYLFNLGFVGLALFVSVLAAVLVNLRRGVSHASDTMKVYLVAAVFGVTSICVNLLFGEIYNTALLMWAFVGVALRLAVAAYDQQAAFAETDSFERPQALAQQ